MRYQKEEGIQESPSQGHPNYHSNVAFYEKMMLRVLWIYPDENWSETTGFSNPVRFHKDEISASFTSPVIHAKDLFPQGIELYRNCVNGEQWMDVLKARRHTDVVSFHQSSRASPKENGFKEQLCDILNHIGSLGYLRHRFKENDGSPLGGADPDDRWGDLF